MCTVFAIAVLNYDSLWNTDFEYCGVFRNRPNSDKKQIE